MIDGRNHHEICQKHSIPFTTFELITGHRRVQAAKEIGWNEIEGNVANVSDSEALFLALKTNMMREDMSEVEQGKVLHEITEKYNLSNVELAKKLGKSEFWVRSRIKLAFNLHENVAKALEAGTIGFKVAEIISGLDPRSQNDFLLYISGNNIKDESEVRIAKKRFLNNTIYTIGYEGRGLQTFIQTLKDNGIEQLTDIRYSNECSDPHFSGKFFAEQLAASKINYVYNKDLSVFPEWQIPYEADGIPIECYKRYYLWHLKQIDFPAVVNGIKESGKTVLMCTEQYAKPQQDQKTVCHRSILAERLEETGEFKETIHL